MANSAGHSANRKGSPSVPGTRVKERSGSWDVRADHLGAFRRLVTASVGGEPITRAQVRIERWRRPHHGWTGTPGLAGVDSWAVNPKVDGVEVEIAVREAVDPAALLAGVLRTLQPTVTGFPAPTWSAGVPASGMLAEQVRDVLHDGDADPHLRRADVLLVPSGAEVADATAERVVVVTEGKWGERNVLIDPTIHRPHGRSSDFVGEVVDATSIVAKYRLGVDMPDVKPLRAISAVTDASSLPTWLRAQLAALGVVLVESDGELPAQDDHLSWQNLSVSGRREALRDFSPWPAVQPWPTVSILLSTHRPERLDHALAMVRRQDYPHLQAVIVLHGNEEDVAHHAPRVRSALDG